MPSAIRVPALVPRTRSSRSAGGKSVRELRVQRGTRIIELLVVLGFRSSYLNVPRALTNFGIGPLADDLVARKKLRDLLGGGLRRVRPVHGILADGLGVELADGAGGGFCR